MLQVLTEHLEDQNVEGFTDAVKEYDSISRLDQWYTSILLRIKKQINDNPDLRWLPPTQSIFVAASRPTTDPFSRLILLLALVYYSLTFYCGESAFQCDQTRVISFFLYTFKSSTLLKTFLAFVSVLVFLNYNYHKLDVKSLTNRLKSLFWFRLSHIFTAVMWFNCL